MLEAFRLVALQCESPEYGWRNSGRNMKTNQRTCFYAGTTDKVCAFELRRCVLRCMEINPVSQQETRLLLV